MLRLYMDVHVKAAITTGVKRRGIDVVTAQEDRGRRLEDAALLARATRLGRVLFSQDDDLLAIARAQQSEGEQFSGLIYGHQLAATIGKYVLDLELVCTVLEPEDMVNRIEYLPLDEGAHMSEACLRAMMQDRLQPVRPLLGPIPLTPRYAFSDAHHS